MSTHPSVQDIIKEARGQRPRSKRCPLTPNSGSVQICLDKQAVCGAGHDPEDPGAVTQYVSERHDLIVIDLSQEEREIGLFQGEQEMQAAEAEADE